VPLTLPLPGAHATANFLAAAAVALRLGVSPDTIAREARAVGAAPGRGRILTLNQDVVLIDDCYNANPVAVEAAVKVLAAQRGRRRVAFLGEMLELGAAALDLHREVGARVAGEIDVLVAIGPLAEGFVMGAGNGASSGARLLHVRDAAAAAAVAPEVVRPGDAVLVKASRGVKAEAVVEALVARFGRVEA
jgi:UDP-N-acetylmuramoyl-tripeptide--D-alanyl-D-alanine ligase